MAGAGDRLHLLRQGIINQIRTFLLERGIAVRQGLRFWRAELPRILATPPEILSSRMVHVIELVAFLRCVRTYVQNQQRGSSACCDRTRTTTVDDAVGLSPAPEDSQT
jgi:hypothetical protein